MVSIITIIVTMRTKKYSLQNFDAYRGTFSIAATTFSIEIFRPTFLTPFKSEMILKTFLTGF